MAYSNNRYPARKTSTSRYAKPAAAKVEHKVLKASPAQAAVTDWVANGTGSATVISVAGSGKTSTIMLVIPVIPEDRHVLAIAFGKEIATELNARIEALREYTGKAFANVKASTVHSLGFGVLARSGKIRGKIFVNTKNNGKLLDLCAAKMSGEDCETYAAFASQLVSLAKGEGIGAITPDTEQNWFNLVYHHDVMLDGEGDEGRGVELARQLLRWSNEQAQNEGVIDFNDQLYLPLLWKLNFWQNDFVIVDEAQDTNPVRRAIARRSLKSTGRLIAFGDPCQGIFGFTGASHDALDQIKKEFGCIELPLTVSYRCSKAVVAAAKEIVPYIEASDTAQEGSVSALATGALTRTLTAQDAILCRNTAPLVSLAYSLIRQGTACRILGREIGTGLINLVRMMKAKDMLDLDSKLGEYEAREVAKYNARGEDQKAEQVRDRVACVRALTESNVATIDELCTKIADMFSDYVNGVLTLSTVHKAKGKEWDQVAILQPELMPSRWARQDWQKVQEENLRYVAYTRAKRNLFILVAGNDNNKPEERKAA